MHDKSDSAAIHIHRRKFVQAVGLGTAALALSTNAEIQAAELGEPIAGFEKLVPPDKKLDPAWLASLTERGKPDVWRGPQLKWIGMPIGGLCAGQLYLGGDGQLWHWDIMNEPEQIEFSGGGSARYAKPRLPKVPFKQGFGLKIIAGGETQNRELNQKGFSEISFRGEYPVARVEFRDPKSPVEVSLAAFSPFIPLNTEDSTLPATVLQYTVKNTSKETIHGEMVGWLQNPVCFRSARKHEGKLHNRVYCKDSATSVLSCSASPIGKNDDITTRPDFGTISLALLNHFHRARGYAEQPERDPFAEDKTSSIKASGPLGKPLVGSLRANFTLQPGDLHIFTFVIAWHFPSTQYELDLDAKWFAHTWGQIKDIKKLQRHYATRFDSSDAVVAYVAKNIDRLSSQTLLWNRTWYDSTLPYWLLDRTFIPIDCLATCTAHWFSNGRFYGWEGVYSCQGTCTHVWHYAQGMARLFPELERSSREISDFDVGYDRKTGWIGHRAESPAPHAIDGQAGTILRVYREHQMSADDKFLRRLWPQVKQSIEALIREDGNQDGILEGAQHNTLDASWYGPVAWLSALYLASLRAGEAMANEVGDTEFATRCRTIAEAGTKNIPERLFNGQYFIQIRDPRFPKANGSGNGCEIDQVLGQSWVYQVGLPRVLPEDKTRQALNALWRYNFTPDVGPYRAQMRTGRWFAMPGEGGLLMCTWPHGGGKDALSRGDALFAGYFNECMTGFEYQVASHMIWEGTPDFIQKGLAITRTIHDRYDPMHRNPYNEIECGDHYSRAMASYGVFLAVCGFEYHGPQGHIGFAPRLTPENFRVAFTAAEGWGTFSQRQEATMQHASLEVRWGKLRLRTVSLQLPEGGAAHDCQVTLAGKSLDVRHASDGRRLTITLAAEATIEAGQTIEMKIDLTK
ncbi:MAG: hypothetical protein K8T25_13045 [Planctomycetia bacterium]|nr:hypothetical protein [Planctomycetia bacterium]